MVLEVKRAVENFPFLGKNANSCTPVILSIYGTYLHMYVIFLSCPDGSDRFLMANIGTQQAKHTQSGISEKTTS